MEAFVQMKGAGCAAVEGADTFCLFGERSDSHAAVCDPMLLEVVTQDGRVLGSAQVTWGQAVAGVQGVAHEPDMGAQGALYTPWIHLLNLIPCGWRPTVRDSAVLLGMHPT